MRSQSDTPTDLFLLSNMPRKTADGGNFLEVILFTTDTKGICVVTKNGVYHLFTHGDEPTEVSSLSRGPRQMFMSSGGYIWSSLPPYYKWR